MSNILVLGANGFLGKHLVRSLASQAENHIRAFDRFPEYASGQSVPFAGLDNVELYPGNFLNREEISEALDGIEYVFHFISTTNPAISNKDPYVDIDTNVRASVMLFDLCVQHGVKRVIFPSSGGTVYGNTDRDNINESVLPEPISPYGIGKLTIEHYLRYFQNTAGLDYLVFRIANPYGPGQNVHGKQGVIPIFLNGAMNNETLTVYGEGTMVRDYIYIDDLVAMITGSYNKPHEYNVYNLGSNKGRSVNEIIAAIEKAAETKLSLRHVEVPPTFVEKSVLNTDRFISEFMIEPQTTFDEGIAKTWQALHGAR